MQRGFAELNRLDGENERCERHRVNEQAMKFPLSFPTLFFSDPFLCSHARALSLSSDSLNFNFSCSISLVRVHCFQDNKHRNTSVLLKNVVVIVISFYFHVYPPPPIRNCK